MTLAPGQQIGTYRIERVLGAGGMGVVYVAIDMRLGRRAAIKQLLPQFSTDHDIVERFFNEAKAAASINHPSIVEIYDVGWHTDGSAFFAMKLLEGETVGRRVRTTRGLPIEIAATIARQVAGALGAAHAAGIVHRDLKPDNIMLVRDDEVVIGERAIVLDFGIAKLFSDGAASSKTKTGTFMGTPAYMSPEQCRGAGDVDQRTDVYALGCILFEMLAGRPPFVAQGSGEIVGMHQFVEAPSIRTMRDVPPELDALLARSLAKHPDARVPSMQDFALALSPFAVQGVHTRPPAPAGMGATQLTAPPGLASTYASSRGEVSKAPAPKGMRIPTFVFSTLVVVAIVALAIVFTCRASTKTDESASRPPDDASSDPADRVTRLKAEVNRHIAAKNWNDALIAVQKWIDTVDNDDEANQMLRKIQEETAAEHAYKDLVDANKRKDHMAGLNALERIPPKSAYRDKALEEWGRLRKHYIETAIKEAKHLASLGKCDELAALQSESTKIGPDAYAATTGGITCIKPQ